MKTIYKIMLAALAAAVALASCTKEFAEQNERDPKADGIRTIGVSFDKDTRSTLAGDDGVTPMFVEGDSIMVSNGKKFETCIVFFSDSLQRNCIRTALKGHLSAVYPAKCAKMNGAEITGILVPSIQSGRFKDANIAVAGIDEDSEYALFKNKTAVLKFYVDQTIRVLDIGIKETEDRMIANAYLDENGKIVELSEDGGNSYITVGAKREAAKYSLEMKNIRRTLNELLGDRICYVAILPTKTGESYNLNVTTHTLSEQGGGKAQKRELASLTSGTISAASFGGIGDITKFLSYSGYFSSPIINLSKIINSIQSSLASAERVFALLDEKEEEPDRTDAEGNDLSKGLIEFKDVSFRYVEDRPLIEGLNITARPGSVTAIVGPTGAGKTTIVNLLMRFYDVNSGAIYIDGTDIRDISRNKLRSVFGMVLQDTWLFKGTVKENIRYGNADATDEEIEAAARSAHAYDFIMAMPGGFDATLEEDGANISQGQKQLITIARAIVANPTILILDEATSSVDTKTEQQIQTAHKNAIYTKCLG